MGVTLQRTGFSPNIKERLDYSCAIYDREGRTIAQGDHLPVHLGAMPLSVRAAIEHVRMEPGDMVVLNDPFKGGTHLPDITLVAPVFLAGAKAGDRPAFFAGESGASLGCGRDGVRGRCLCRARSFRRGLILPPVRLVKGGAVDRELLAVILANVRTPGEREGDLTAQIAANRVGEARLLRMVARYGLEVVERYAGEVQDYAERVLRSTLRAVPDGVYRFCDALDNDGFSEGRGADLLCGDC